MKIKVRRLLALQALAAMCEKDGTPASQREKEKSHQMNFNSEIRLFFTGCVGVECGWAWAL